MCKIWCFYFESLSLCLRDLVGLFSHGCGRLGGWASVHQKRLPAGCSELWDDGDCFRETHEDLNTIPFAACSQRGIMFVCKLSFHVLCIYFFIKLTWFHVLSRQLCVF